MARFIIAIIILMLVFVAATSMILYTSEINKSKILRSETQKTAEESKRQIKSLEDELKQIRRKGSEEKQKLLTQIDLIGKEKDAALEDQKKYAQYFYDERELSMLADEDLETLRDDYASLKQKSRDELIRFQQGYKRKRRSFQTRILSLEAQITKARQRLTKEADRYHYNLGVVYAQNKDYDSAVREFKTALGYNDANVMAHYNLGIIYDDYYKDRKNAIYHYEMFLKLSPASDDAESVREWLKNLE